ncbi:helix-turn-helix domain-containing protein [Micromonospora sp. LOL_024]|uniref:helix-turn-helix domain-containing protein n=1 Tax=Micromonospora sp. LOL_024 TaxID=3345412 RepID=UPI003A858353
MATSKDLPDVGGFIRDLRRNAKISLRQLAEQTGVSNPYLSQIERGLRRPSAEVLQQLATALRVSTPAMYLRAGLLDDKEGQGVLAAIAVDPDLTMAQRQSLTQIYETFRRENARFAEATSAAGGADEGTGVANPAPGTSGGSGTSGTSGTSDVNAPDLANLAATGPTTAAGTPTEAVIESVAVTEAGAAPAPNRAEASTRTPDRKATRKVVRRTATAVEEEK